MDLELTLRLKLAAQEFVRALGSTTSETTQSFNAMRDGAKAASTGIGEAYQTLGQDGARDVQALTAATQQFVRALEGAAAEATQSFNTMRAGARAASDDIGAAYRTLGLQSATDIRAQIASIEDAYKSLARSGQISADEQIRAARQATDAIGQLNRQLSTDNLGGAWRTLAVRSFQDIRAEISRTQSAYYTLSASGKLSAEELSRAAEAAAARVAELQRELSGTGFDDAFAQLGMRSFASLRDEITKTSTAYTTLARSGRLTGTELAQAAAAAEAKIADLTDQLQGGRAAAAAEAYRTLGVRAFADIRAEITRTQDAYRQLSRSGQLSAEEQARAIAATRERVTALKRELAGAGNEQAYQTLGVRSLAAIRSELAETQAAYTRLSSTANLSGAELTRVAAATRVRMRELNAEMSATAPAAAGGSSAISGLTQNLLAAAGAYLTFQGALQAARAAITGALTLDRILTGLTSVVGTSERAAQEFAFVRAEADRLGLNLASAAQEYTKLAAATRGTALEGQKTRDIFSAVSEAASVLGLSTDEASGALLAIQQMVSKGTVAAEELRGQLGERLPGAFQIAARAMGTTTQGLSQLLEQGAVASDVFLPRFAAELRKTFQDGLPSAVGSARAEFARLQNTVFETAATVGRSGLNERLAEAARILSEKLADPQVQQALKTAGIALGDMAIAAAKLSGELASLAKIVAGGLIVGKLTSGLAESGRRAAETGAEIGKLRTAAMALSSVNVYLTIGLIGIEAARAGAKAIADYALEHRKLSQQEQTRAAELQRQLPALQATIDAQQRYANVQVKTAEDIARLTPQQLAAYRDELTAKKALEAAQIGLGMRTQELLGYQVQQEKSGRNNADMVKLLTQQQSAAERETQKWATAIAATNEGLTALDNATRATSTAVEMAVLPAVNRLLAAFDAQIAKSPEVATALGKVFEGFNANSVTSIQTVFTTLDELGTRGKASATQIRTAIEKELGSLQLDGLTRLQIAANAAFGSAGADAQRLALVLDTTLKLALDKLGLSLDGAQTGLSKQFTDIQAAFDLLATNVRAKAPEIRAATDRLIDAAKTTQELQATRAQLELLGASGKLAGDAMETAFARVENRLRELSSQSVQAAKDQTSVAQAQSEAHRADNDVVRAYIQLQREGTAVAEANLAAAEAEARAQQDAADAVAAQVAAKEAARKAQAEGTDSARLQAEQAQRAADEAARLAEESRQASIQAKSLADDWALVSESAQDAARDARRAGDGAQKVVGDVGSVGGGVAAVINDIRSGVSALGEEATQRFSELTGALQAPTTAAGRMAMQLQAARGELSGLLSSRPIGDAIGISTALNSMATAAARVKVEVLEGRQRLQEQSEAALRGADAAKLLAKGYAGVGDAIRQSSRDAISSSASFANNAASIRDELLRLQGREAEIEERRYRQRVDDLQVEYKLAEAKLATARAQAQTDTERSAVARSASELATSRQESLADLEEIHKRTLANIAEEERTKRQAAIDEANRAADQQRKDLADAAGLARQEAANQPSTLSDNLVQSVDRSTTAANDAARAAAESTTPARRVRIDLVSGGRTITADIDPRDENDFIRILQTAQGRAAS